jgi:hypothetical protein
MAIRYRIVVALVWSVGFLAQHSGAEPLSPGRISIKTGVRSIRAGDKFTVDVSAETPTIYGAEWRMHFNPDLLEVVDADATEVGIQAMPGSFLPATQGAVLRNQADNTEGTVVYALTLLRPAAPVHGTGALATLTFRGRRAGAATIELTEGLFGTQRGEAIVPTLFDRAVEIRIDDASGAPVTGPTRGIGISARATGGVTAVTAYVQDYLGGRVSGRNVVILTTLGGAAFLGLMVAAVKRARRRVRR